LIWGNSILIIFGLGFLAFSTWLKAVVVLALKIIFDIAFLFVLDKEIKETFLGFSIMEKFRIGWSIKRK
jgi:hypothetical protein